MEEKRVIALGFFDGVHLGHQALLQQCRILSAQQNCGAAAVTFDLPPNVVLQNQLPKMITSVQDRCALLRQYGADAVQILPSTKELLATPWDAFLSQLVTEGAAGFVCGEDYRFGYQGLGDSRKLAEFARERGIPCIVVPEQKMDGEKISSTRIRTLLEQGEIEEANRLLGHPHIFTGQVVSGRKLGRTMGIPTANLQFPPEVLIPRFGVYACLACFDGEKYPAVANVGTRPTVGGHKVTAEPWILDFEGDLYGKTVTLEMHQFLRPEKKFDSLDTLREEIQKNAAQTRKFFEKK